MNLLFLSLICNNLRIFDVTRQSSKKSVGLTVIMALLIAIALGLSDMVSEDQTDSLVHEFGELLEGVEAEILSIPNDTTPAFNTAGTMQVEKIHAEISYLQAFDEAIRKQVL
jgi:hypothetical protein